jgi:hypothetical protein
MESLMVTRTAESASPNAVLLHLFLKSIKGFRNGSASDSSTIKTCLVELRGFSYNF